MLVTKYGLNKPARINYGAEDPGPRGIFNASSEDFLRYPLWILEKPDGTQVFFPGMCCVQNSRSWGGRVPGNVQTFQSLTCRTRLFGDGIVATRKGGGGARGEGALVSKEARLYSTNMSHRRSWGLVYQQSSMSSNNTSKVFGRRRHVS